MAPYNYSHKQRLVFMRQDSPPRVEGVVDGVVVEVGESGGVDVSKPEESTREVSRVVVSSEDTAKLRVEHLLRVVSAESRVQ